MNCPCGSSNPYENCCEPFLSGEAFPDTAEKLMRSRYTAYTRADIGYVESTMAAEAGEDFDAAEAKQWAEGSTWKGLKIASVHKGGPADKTGMVEFTATYEKDGEGIEHHEVSRFRRSKEGKWLFVDGDAHTHREGEGHRETTAPITRARPKIGRNDPCHCGSGRKYKKCCEDKEA